MTEALWIAVHTRAPQRLSASLHQRPQLPPPPLHAPLKGAAERRRAPFPAVNREQVRRCWTFGQTGPNLGEDSVLSDTLPAPTPFVMQISEVHKYADKWLNNIQTDDVNQPRI